MRKIEQEMLDALNGQYNWRLDNTEVKQDREADVAGIYLHGNLIASVAYEWGAWGDLEIESETLARWPTSTTKSRLRALGADVVTRKGITYVDGDAI